MDLYDGESALAALAGLAGSGAPITLLTAPRGLLNEVPGIYSPSEVERWRAELPAVTIREVPDVNHYTIVLGAKGASAIADQLRRRQNGQK